MKAPKLRVAAAGLFAAVGLSLLGSLAAPVASADPRVPGSGPLHPDPPLRRGHHSTPSGL